MERKAESKLRILHLRDILAAHCGRENAVSMADILRLLAQFEICAERKSIYDDLKQLERYGMRIGRMHGGRHSRYYSEPPEKIPPRFR